MTVAPGIINYTINMYTDTFCSHITQFVQWGQWLFYGCIIIAIVWLSLWKAFDNNSFQQAMPSFIKELCIIAFFYTIMINCAPWLGSIASTGVKMGTILARQKVDPTSIISNGIAIGNLMLAPVSNSGISSIGLGTIIIALAYIIVFAAFLFIALDLAITLLLTTFFIAIAGLMLAFAVFPFTRAIARNTLDVVIGNSFKLLCLYAIIAAGNDVFARIIYFIPRNKIDQLDIYGWIVATALLFALIAKTLPTQVLRIVSNAIIEHRGNEAATIFEPATRTTQIAIPDIKIVDTASYNLAKIADSSVTSTAANFNKATIYKGDGDMTNIDPTFATINDFNNTTGSSLSSHFKNIANKLTKNQSAQESPKNTTIKKFMVPPNNDN